MQSSIMQTEDWAVFKAQFGWQHRHIKQLYVLKRSLKAGYNFLYIPEMGGQHDGLATLAAEAQSALATMRDERSIFGRAEFLLPFTQSAHSTLLRAGFVKARDEAQPEWRQEIDLTLDLDEIRASMKPKGRYNVGIAQKRGVSVSLDSSLEAVQSFLNLNRQTIVRKNFHGRDSSYLTVLIEMLEQSGMGGLWVARYGGQVLAGAVVTVWGDRASYLYGASAEQHRSVMAPYLLHYTIMQEARQRGCKIYDLIGVTPPGASKKHPWSGISRFKREFGGQTVHFLGSYDRVYRPVLYTVYATMRKR